MHRPYLLSSLALVVVCALIGACQTTQGPLRFYQRNDGDIINVRVGEVFQVVLNGDPGTDIHWLSSGENAGILEQVGSTSYETDPESLTFEQRLVTSFRGVEEGRTRLQLQYRNPAEDNRDTTFDVWVVVTPSR